MNITRTQDYQLGSLLLDNIEMEVVIDIHHYCAGYEDKGG